MCDLLQYLRLRETSLLLQYLLQGLKRRNLPKGSKGQERSFEALEQIWSHRFEGTRGRFCQPGVRRRRNQCDDEFFFVSLSRVKVSSSAFPVTGSTRRNGGLQEHARNNPSVHTEDTKKSIDHKLKREHARTTKRVGGKNGKKHVRGIFDFLEDHHLQNSKKRTSLSRPEVL